jgi:hypothetical protein
MIVGLLGTKGEDRLVKDPPAVEELSPFDSEALSRFCEDAAGGEP